MQLIVYNVAARGLKALQHLRLSSKQLRACCDDLITSHTLVLDPADAQWQLEIIQRFGNLRELRVDLRRSSAEPQELYQLLARVVHCAPELQTLHVLCGRSDSSGRLALPTSRTHIVVLGRLALLAARCCEPCDLPASPQDRAAPADTGRLCNGGRKPCCDKRMHVCYILACSVAVNPSCRSLHLFALCMAPCGVARERHATGQGTRPSLKVRMQATRTCTIV